MTISSATGQPRDEDASLHRGQPELSPEIVSWALDGNLAAVDHLLTIARTIAVRYCRARVGRRNGSFDDADRLAYEACVAAFASLRDSPDHDIPFLAVVYRSASAAVGRTRRQRGADVATLTDTIAELVAAFPARQRETLVLRMVVGLSATQTAQALGWQARAVHDVEHQALTRLRASLPSP